VSRAWAGWGGVVRGLAGRPEIGSLPRAWRMDSMLRTRGVQPRSWQTSASRPSVQVERPRPRVRGLWCNKARRGSSKEASSRGLALLGREDLGRRQAKPSAWKARMALRAEAAVQPRVRAIRAGLWPAGPGGRGQQSLAGAQGEGVGGGEASLEVLPLGVGQGSDKGRDGSHAPLSGPRPVTESPLWNFH